MKCPPVIVVQLVHIFGPMKGEIQEFMEELISIGRHPSCSLRFPVEFTAISRRHAEIKREGNRHRLTDYSTNGTFVNGKKVGEVLLKDGDVLEISEGGPKFSFLTRTAEIPAGINEVLPLSGEKEQTPAKEEIMGESPGGKSLSAPEISNSQQSAKEPPAGFYSSKTSVPLVIQYGPTIRTFKELPVTIGKNQKCEFVLLHPSILDRHAEILFHQNQYWIKDLSGQNLLRINDLSIEFQAPLNPEDEISLSLHGPVFRYVGEGRLAEVAMDSVEKSSSSKDAEEDTTKKTGVRDEKKSKGFWSTLLKK